MCLSSGRLEMKSGIGWSTVLLCCFLFRDEFAQLHRLLVFSEDFLPVFLLHCFFSGGF